MCGVGYADTHATQADYDRFYADQSKYEDSATSTGSGINAYDAARLRETALLFSEVIPTNASVLDIGCANGGLLASLQELGYTRLFGTDPSPRCVANTLAMVPHASVEVGFLNRSAFDGQLFDLVTLTHVMEHVCDVGAAMRTVREQLIPGGLLYLEVPDAARYHESVPSPFQDFNTEHINHFSPKTLAALASVHGFKPVRVGTRTFLAPPPFPFPAAYGLFCKAGERERERAYRSVPDRELEDKLREYVVESDSLMRRIDAQIKAVLSQHMEVIIWGTGQLAMKLLLDSSLKNARIVAMVDGNPINQGKQLAGQSIQSPESIAGLHQPIIIATTLHHQAISNAIRNKYHYTNQIVVLGDRIQ